MLSIAAILIFQMLGLANPVLADNIPPVSQQDPTLVDPQDPILPNTVVVPGRTFTATFQINNPNSMDTQASVNMFLSHGNQLGGVSAIIADTPTTFTLTPGPNSPTVTYTVPASVADGVYDVFVTNGCK